MSDLKKDALLMAKTLLDNRLQWEAIWKDVRTYLAPTRGRFDNDLPNTSKIADSATKRINGAPSRALRTLCAGMHSGLTSPAQKWFKLSLQDQDLVKYRATKNWLQAVEDILYGAFSRSNFYSSIHSLYYETAGFGTGALFVEENLRNFFNFRVFTTGTYALGVDESGMVDSLYRTLYHPARVCVQKWGDKVRIETKNLSNTQPDAPVKICHIVYPRKSYDPDKIDNKNMPFQSLYWEYGSNEDELLEESGYREFPLMAPRWDLTADDVYGQGPGLESMADGKTLQQEAKGYVMTLQLMNQPPTVESPSWKGRINSGPKGRNRGNPEEIKPLFQPNLNGHAALNEAIISLERAMREWFFNDLFVYPLIHKEMTATEVAERHEEKLLLLGPVIERQQYELLNPLLDRCFNILASKGILPLPPPEIQGQTMKIDFISMLAQAQKATKAASVTNGVAFAASLAQMAPATLDKLDADAAFESYADAVGMPPNILRGSDEVEKIRESRAKQQMEQEQMQKDSIQAETAKSLNQAGMMEGQQGA